MTARKNAAKKTTAAKSDYRSERIAWIDRMTRAIDSYPGAPVATSIAHDVTKLRNDLWLYRDGFVHGINVSKALK